MMWWTSLFFSFFTRQMSSLLVSLACFAFVSAVVYYVIHLYE